MSICTNIKVHGSDVRYVGGCLYARMHFVHIDGFTQGSGLFIAHCARNLSTWYPAFVFMSRYITYVYQARKQAGCAEQNVMLQNSASHAVTGSFSMNFKL